MAKKKAGRPKKASVGGNADLEALKKQQAEIAAKIRATEKAARSAVFDTKKAEVAAARTAVREASAKLAKLEKELASLGGKPGRKTASGRKPRVLASEKMKYVEEALKKFGRGVSFSDLKKELLSVTLPGTKAPVFSVPDFGSAAKFSKTYLPSGWKVEGSRRTAKVVKG